MRAQAKRKMRMRQLIAYTARVAGDDWVGTTEAAQLLGVSRSTVLRSLRNEDRRIRWWGARGDGWRYAPLSDPERPIFQVRRARAVELAGGGPVE